MENDIACRLFIKDFMARLGLMDYPMGFIHITNMLSDEEVERFRKEFYESIEKSFKTPIIEVP